MELTVKEAIEEGYTRYGFSNREWQSAEELHDGVFEEVEEDNWEDLVLFEKISSCPSIDSASLAELISDNIGETDSEECMRDDEVVYDTVRDIDYSEITETINKALKKYEYWMLTSIKLIK